MPRAMPAVVPQHCHFSNRPDQRHAVPRLVGLGGFGSPRWSLYSPQTSRRRAGRVRYAAAATEGTALATETQPANADPTAELRERLAEVRGKIADACKTAGRRPETVTLVAVTKYAAPEQVRAAITLGVGDFGENYAVNLAQRATQFGEFHRRSADAGGGDAKPLRWHMLGHLQRNKVKQVLPHTAMLQTLDSLRLAEELDASVPKLLGPGGRLPCLMQINVAEETQKTGVAVGAATHLAATITEMPHLRLMGLMCMAEEGAPVDKTRRTFARCREIFEEMKHLGIGGDDLRHLSMGMSGDYEAGVLEGATVVRVGSALFGGQADAAADQ